MACTASHARNMMLSMEMTSSQKPVLFHSWLTDITFHTRIDGNNAKVPNQSNRLPGGLHTCGKPFPSPWPLANSCHLACSHYYP